jgi:hypothetical protein
MRTCREIMVFNFFAQQEIAYATADDVGDVAGII